MNQPNYKLGTRTLIFSTVLAIIIIFALFGCGSRKVERSKTETKETATFKDSSKTVTKLESNTKIVDFSQIDEIEIVPIDVNKPFFVNNVEYKNAVLKAKKVRNNITTDKTTNVSQIKQNDVKKAVTKTAKSNTKQSDKKQYDLTKTIIVISIILCISIWIIYFFYFRKSKKVVDEVTSL